MPCPETFLTPCELQESGNSKSNLSFPLKTLCSCSKFINIGVIEAAREEPVRTRQELKAHPKVWFVQLFDPREKGKQRIRVIMDNEAGFHLHQDLRATLSLKMGLK